MTSSNVCKVCNSKTSEVFRATVLNKYDVAYYHCTNCGLLQTEAPYWLNEAYGEAISILDTGLIQRNIHISDNLAHFLFFLFGRNKAYIDVAGGYGMLVRLMRDIGFDYYWSDKYCKNIFAKNFEANNASSPVGALTAFEVLEHLHDPVSWLKEVFDEFDSPALIFTTEVYSGNLPPHDWWYYAREGGQHITFYQEKTLSVMAKRLNLFYKSCNGFHIISKTPIEPPFLYKLLSTYFPALMSKYIRRKMVPKTFADHVYIKRLADASSTSVK